METSAAAPIVCFGELLIRLTATGGQPLYILPQLEPYIGGAEANVALGMQRLGHKARMISVIPDNDLGQAALYELRRYGVDTSLIRSSEGRMGLYFLTQGAMHRASEIIYDRAYSAFALHDFSGFDWHAALSGAEWLHISGVTAALGPNLFEAALSAMKTARELGVKVAYDGNYRPKLWAQWKADAPALIEKLMHEADLIIGGYRDFELVLKTKFEGAGFDRQHLAAQAGFAAFPRLSRIASTERTQISADHNQISGQMFTRDASWKTKNFELSRIIDRIGGGDAFAVGLFHGLMSGVTPQTCLDYAMAIACLKHAQPGDLCLVTSTQLDAFLSEDGFDVKR